MTLELRWTAAAQRDLLDIWLWRGREQPERGDQIIVRIEAACARLVRFPELGPLFPRASPDARKISVDIYVVFYRVEIGTVRIVRVLDQRRLLDATMFENN